MKILQIIHMYMYMDKQSPKINIKTQHLQFNNKVKKFKKDISSQVFCKTSRHSHQFTPTFQSDFCDILDPPSRSHALLEPYC